MSLFSVSDAEQCVFDGPIIELVKAAKIISTASHFVCIQLPSIEVQL